jgi:guanylate kinase
MEISKKGLLLILSGPAGSGKGCIVKNILEKDNNIRLSVSATTREPRPGEIEGFHYYFVTHEKFTELIDSDEMLEYTMYCGNYYGTPKEKVRRMIDSGISVILEIELEGAKNVKRLCPDAVSVLVLPPDFGTLEQRLRGRHTNTEEDIKNRLNRAKSEVASYDLYDYIVINEDDKIDEAADNILQILNAECHRTSRNPNIPTDFFN